MRLSLAASLGIILLGIGCIAALFSAMQGGFTGILYNDTLYLVGFSLQQAFLSALLSVGFALMISLGIVHLCRFRLFAQHIAPPILNISAMMIVLPTTIAAHAVLIVWGRHGLYTPIRELFDFPLFGLGGILLGHMFLNLPLALRLIASSLLNLPEGLRRQAIMLGFSPTLWWRILAYPTLRPVLVGVFSLVFLLCFTSFALVLMLGGGPAAATLEVAIYEAVRFEMDFARAGLLSIVQLLLCGAFLLLNRANITQLGGLSIAPPLPSPPRPLLSVCAIAILCLGAAFLLPPLSMIVWRGMGADFFLWLTQPIFYQSLFYSLGIALGSAVGNILLCLLLVRSLVRHGLEARLAHLASSLFLFIPTVVFGTGLFLLLRHFAYPSFTAPMVVCLANILFTLPFSMRILAPALQQDEQLYHRQYRLLGMSTVQAGWWGAWRAHKTQIRFAAALSAAFSLGDLGVIALFNADGFTTLPWLLYTSLGRYQTNEAAALAVWLLILVFAMFTLKGKHSPSHA